MSEQELKLEKPKWGQGYYWSESEDGIMFGPFDSHEQAAQEMWDEGFGKEKFLEISADEGGEFTGFKEEFLATWEFIGPYHHGPISTDTFTADLVLENLEERNEDKIWDGNPPDWPEAAKRELEMMLGDALYRWLEKHNLWSQFRILS